MSKPKIFVLMPFAKEFDDIYKIVISDTLETGGYLVTRADDLLNQRNIIGDIIENIKNSDLIIADLSTSNPNVYYELGIAHTLNKPVILLTQKISDIPFDIQPYRIIEYNTYFANISDAKNKLLETTNGLVNGTLSFGNPYTDFGKNDFNTTSTKNEKIINAGSIGILDLFADTEEGFNDLSGIIKNISLILNSITDETKLFTSDVNKANNNPSSTTATHLRKLTRSLAKKQESFNDKLSVLNKEYWAKINVLKIPLEEIAKLPIDDNDNDYKDYFEKIAYLRQQTLGAKNSFSKLLNTTINIPNIEKFYDNARNRTVNELKLFIESLEMTISVLDRVVNLYLIKKTITES